MIYLCEGGYGLVVERVLAKDEAGVRFSLSAQRESDMKIDLFGSIFISERAVVEKNASNSFPHSISGFVKISPSI